MKQAAEVKNTARSTFINRMAYALYLLLVLYFALSGDYESAIINLGIALVFDPFNASVKWHDRPLYQRAWLLCHLILTFAGFAFLMLR